MMYRSHIGRQQAAHNAVILVDVAVDWHDPGDDVAWHLISIGTGKSVTNAYLLYIVYVYYVFVQEWVYEWVYEWVRI